MAFHRSPPTRRREVLGSASLLLLVAMTASAQSIPGAVLAQREPHHHLVYEDSTLRVLRVRVAGHDTTLLHEHDPDYFWLGLGTSTIINARLGSPDATLVSGDLKFHYSFGKFAHVARNPEATPFDNITVELLQPQTDVRNLCEAGWRHLQRGARLGREQSRSVIDSGHRGFDGALKGICDAPDSRQ